MEKHTRKEDWVAILTGTFLTAQGFFFLKSASLLTGGTAGLSLLLSQLFPLSFGLLYFLVNSPFFLLGWKQFGLRFALNSVVSCALVSLIVDHTDRFIDLGYIDPIYCSVIGGVLSGIGMLILFRHHSSLGGFNIACLYIQKKYQISVGKTQVWIDGSIVIASLFFVPVHLPVFQFVFAFYLPLFLSFIFICLSVCLSVCVMISSLLYLRLFSHFGVIFGKFCLFFFFHFILFCIFFRTLALTFNDRF